MKRALALIALCVAATPARADGEPAIVLRIATPAPEGTGWARELRSYAYDVEGATHGGVKLKWYFGGITGDELEMLARAKSGQLDAVGSGGMACERVMPSLAVTRLLGMFQTREEASHIAQTLRPIIEEEARQKGFELLALNGMGADIIFTRESVSSFEELRRLKLWRWELDRTGSRMAELMGMKVVPLSLEQGGPAYDRGDIQGYMAVSAAALAFQWSARARYVIDMKTGFLEGCVLITQRSFDRLSPEQKRELRASSTKLGLRWEVLGAEQDRLLLGGVLAKQGVRVIRPSDAFRAQYFAEAAAGRERMIESGAIKRELVDRVMRALADYRAEHASQ